jgi:hypothetical protein
LALVWISINTVTYKKNDYAHTLTNIYGSSTCKALQQRGRPAQDRPGRWRVISDLHYWIPRTYVVLSS